jgi:hypothetical protein
MSCETCDRNNVIKAYCYFSQRPVLFEEVTGEPFSVEAFSAYAIEVNLSWKIVPCYLSLRSEITLYWDILYKPLKKALQESQLGEPLQ